MSYSRDGDRVTLDMSVEDFELLLYLLGVAAGTADREKDTPLLRRLVRLPGQQLAGQFAIALGIGIEGLWRTLDLANRLNDGNPDFTPYKIPDQYREAEKGGAQ